MKNARTLILALPLVFALAACDKQPEPTLGTNNKDSVNDALDRRPNEKVRDKAEDVGDSMKRSAGDAKDAVKDATN
jgi:hypothetical protein